MRNVRWLGRCKSINLCSPCGLVWLWATVPGTRLDRVARAGGPAVQYRPMCQTRSSYPVHSGDHRNGLFSPTCRVGPGLLQSYKEHVSRIAEQLCEPAIPAFCRPPLPQSIPAAASAIRPAAAPLFTWDPPPDLFPPSPSAVACARYRALQPYAWHWEVPFGCAKQHLSAGH